jgi:hypothetical protein
LPFGIHALSSTNFINLEGADPHNLLESISSNYLNPNTTGKTKVTMAVHKL